MATDDEQITVYLAPKGRVDELQRELGTVERVVDRLVFAPGPPREAIWAQNTWLETRRLEIASIGDAARRLRELGPLWALWSVACHRRAALVQDKLPAVRARPFAFGSPLPGAPMGAWTLLDEHTLVASPRCSSPFPHGELHFAEDHVTPPNRAYLKLWDAFTRIGCRPAPGELCLELGASPGGWTWVLAQLGARVVAVDKAPLDAAIAEHPNVCVVRDSAFALDPHAFVAEHGPVDWLLCDVVCYPQRALELMRRWLLAGAARNLLCTLKFQGATDHQAIADCAAVPGSRLLHLFHNKHELTWIHLDGSSS